LNALKDRLIQLKNKIETTKLKKNKKSEEGKKYLATEKLASAKKIIGSGPEN
jgi:hypothetical protein